MAYEKELPEVANMMPSEEFFIFLWRFLYWGYEFFYSGCITPRSQIFSCLLKETRTKTKFADETQNIKVHI
jgi:hypothetical protein